MATNTSNTVFFKIDPIDYALSQAGQANKAGAFKTLTTAYALTSDQTASIRRILNTFRPDTFMTGEPALKHEIVAVLNVFVSFINDSTSVFSNDYSCQFEFGGEYYTSATVCFHAQPVHNVDVLMHVQRAKFEQNPELRDQLLATGSRYIVCQGHDLFFSDCMIGAGQNSLGECLMRLRGECGGTGIVEPPKSYREEVQNRMKCHLLTNTPYPDVILNLFTHCVSQWDLPCIEALSCVNTHYNQTVKKCCESLSLKQFCPKGLTILDAQALGISVDDEPRINRLEVLKWFKKLVPHVENEGLTLLTMCKGLTLNELVKIAAEPKLGMNVDVWDAVLTELGNEPVLNTYIILITNNVFCKSRNKRYNLQKSLVAEHGCEMPTVQEYVALCVFMRLFDQCLYGRNPLTYGRSSTRVQGYPLVVGGSAPARLEVYHLVAFDDEDDGAGGRREF